ncbi:MAG: hypothetical protein ACRBI6_14970 [Acidimicrobiales bacterium]
MTDERDPDDLDAPIDDAEHETEAAEPKAADQATEPEIADETTEPEVGEPEVAEPEIADQEPATDWAPPPPPAETAGDPAADDRRWPRRLALGAAVAAFGLVSMLAGGAIATALDGDGWWDDHDRQHHSDGRGGGDRHDGRR